MLYEIHENELLITCSIKEIEHMLLSGDKLYAVPNQDGEVMHIYMGSRAEWREDFYVANASAFLDAVGMDGTAGIGNTELITIRRGTKCEPR